MKRISFFLTLTLLILSFGLANAQTKSITLDHVVGEWDDGGNRMLSMGATNSFHIRFINNGTPDCVFAPSFAFVISSTDGAEWGGISVDYPTIKYVNIFADIWADVDFTGLFSSAFEEHFTADGGVGAGSDTVGFAGVVSPGNVGLWEGMDTVVFVLNIEPTVASEGKNICFSYGGDRDDGYTWGWNGVGIACQVELADVTNDGEQCFGVGKPPDLPPDFTNCPTTFESMHCDVISYDFDAVDPDPEEGPGPNTVTYSADLGDIDAATGAWSYTGNLAGVGTAITLTVTAHEADNSSTSDCVVNIILRNSAPEFTSGCDQTIFAQTGVQKDVSFAGEDSCSGDPMIMSVIDPGGMTGSLVFNGTTLGIIADSTDLGVHIVTVGISDGVDDGAECTITVNVSAGALYGVEIEKTHDTPQGGFVDVAINLTAHGADLGGYNFLIAYDASALTFQGASAGAVLTECRWEYFTYRYGADGNCNGGCPSGLVRLIGIAETNNGANHPEPGCVFEGSLATLSFLVTNDRTLECQYVPVRFFWIECGDNTLSNAAGTALYIASTVKEYPGDGANLMDDYPDAVFPSFVGPIGCNASGKVEVKTDMDMVNGGVDIVCAADIDDRGDLNLDGLANTIADAVMYSNYFVDGLSALVNVSGTGYAASIAASDVNADGLALTVADLVYLIRVVVGDAQPYPKVTPMAANLIVGNTLSVDAEMGAAFVVLAGDQTPTLLADGMDMKFAFDGENTRVLVWNVDGATFNGEFLGNVGIMISAELAAADGSPVVANKLPANFALGQNYPNPFNPTTSIELALQVASDYTLTIYNVTGQVVETINGSADAGFQTVEWDASNNASGVYFYKLTAGNFTDTKKMVLLK